MYTIEQFKQRLVMKGMTPLKVDAATGLILAFASHYNHSIDMLDPTGFAIYRYNKMITDGDFMCDCFLIVYAKTKYKTVNGLQEINFDEEPDYARLTLFLSSHQYTSLVHSVNKAFGDDADPLVVYEDLVSEKPSVDYIYPLSRWFAGGRSNDIKTQQFKDNTPEWVKYFHRSKARYNVFKTSIDLPECYVSTSTENATVPAVETTNSSYVNIAEFEKTLVEQTRSFLKNIDGICNDIKTVANANRLRTHDLKLGIFPIADPEERENKPCQVFTNIRIISCDESENDYNVEPTQFEAANFKGKLHEKVIKELIRIELLTDKFNKQITKQVDSCINTIKHDCWHLNSGTEALNASLVNEVIEKEVKFFKERSFWVVFALFDQTGENLPPIYTASPIDINDMVEKVAIGILETLETYAAETGNDEIGLDVQYWRVGDYSNTVATNGSPTIIADERLNFKETVLNKYTESFLSALTIKLQALTHPYLRPLVLNSTATGELAGDDFKTTVTRVTE